MTNKDDCIAPTLAHFKIVQGADDNPIAERVSYDNADFKAMEYGLTKREYFAAMALQGVIIRQHTDYFFDKEMCDKAVRLADELIKSLNK